jgi:hypothetical protein
MGNFSDFERGQIIDAHLAGACVTETATLVGVLRVIVSKLVWAYKKHGKTSSVKRNSG